MQQAPKRLTPDDEEYYANVRIGQPLPPMQPAGKPKAKRKAGKPSTRFRLMTRFWRHPKTSKLSSSAQAAWCYLWTLADGKRTCFPSINRIARRLGLARRRTQGCMAELKSAGFVAVLREGNNTGGARARVYQIRVPQEQEGGGQC